MYTEEDVKKMLAQGGEKAAGKRQPYTEQDVKKMLKPYGEITEERRNYERIDRYNRQQQQAKWDAAPAELPMGGAAASADQPGEFSRFVPDRIKSMQIAAAEKRNANAAESARIDAQMNRRIGQDVPTWRESVRMPAQEVNEKTLQQTAKARTDFLGYGARSIGHGLVSTAPMLRDLAVQTVKNSGRGYQSDALNAAKGELTAAENRVTGYLRSNQRLVGVNSSAKAPELAALEANVAAAQQKIKDIERAENINTPLSPESSGMKRMRKARELQERAVSGLPTPLERSAGNLLLGIGQNAALLPLGLISPGVPLAVMGGVASAQKGYELSEQGVGASEALGRGLLSGGIEVLTEKIPLDNMLDILKTGGGTSAVKTLLRQMGTEATEESASYVLNFAADAAANDPNAKFSFSELAQSALGGAVSGGILSGAGMAVNKAARSLGGGENGFGTHDKGTGMPVDAAVMAAAMNEQGPRSRITTESGPADWSEKGMLPHLLGLDGKTEATGSDAARMLGNHELRAMVEALRGERFTGTKAKQRGEAQDFLSGLVQPKVDPILLDLPPDAGIRMNRPRTPAINAREAIRQMNGEMEAPLERMQREAASRDAAQKEMEQRKSAPQTGAQDGYNRIDFGTPELYDLGNGGALNGYQGFGKDANDAGGNRLSRARVGEQAGFGENQTGGGPQAGRSLFGRDRGGLSVSVISEATRAALDARESIHLNMADMTPSPDRFVAALEAGKQSQRFGGLVDSHTADKDARDAPAGAWEARDAMPEQSMLADGRSFGQYIREIYRKYGVNTEEDAVPVMSAEDYAEYQRRYEEADEGRVESLFSQAEAEEAARRTQGIKGAPPAAKEMLADTDNGIIEGADLGEVAQLLSSPAMLYNKDIARALDAAAKGNASKDGPQTPQTTRKVRDVLYRTIEKPWIEAKADYSKAVTKRFGQLASELDRLGIKAGSRESAAVQWIGEGQRQIDEEIVPYSREQLQADFPQEWGKILEAERIFRAMYDEYVIAINNVKKKIYPGAEEKAQQEIDRQHQRAQYYYAQAAVQESLEETLYDRIERTQERLATVKAGTAREADLKKSMIRLAAQQEAVKQTTIRFTEMARKAAESAARVAEKIESGEMLRGKRLLPRKDYFHHFTEIAEGFGGLQNILNSPNEIASTLVGVSENTKPKSKYWGAMQQRKSGAYTEDAVGGMARYITGAEYAIHVDPFIAYMRGTIKNLAEKTETTKNANGLIDFLTDWTGELAGKTNFIDRTVYKGAGSRKVLNELERVNRRVRANAVVGNIGSAMVQIGNIPNAMMYVNHPAYWKKAAEQYANGMMGKPDGLLTEQSPFLQERYLRNVTDQFKPKSPLNKLAENMLDFGDREAAKLIWLAAYNQYEAKGAGAKGMRSYESAVDYADDITRRSIAGRGIGEMPMTQRSRIVQLLAPFQVEVNNTYNLFLERMGEKDAAGLASYCAGAWLVNAMLEEVTGSRPLFDPFDAIFDAIRGAFEDDEEDEEEKNIVERMVGAASRLGGEVVSNLPYASLGATMAAGTENSEKLFGENDPTRYGTGNMAIQKMLKPFAQLVRGENIDALGTLGAFLLPYGGRQLERSTKAAQDFGLLPHLRINIKEGAEIQKNSFPVSRSASGQIRFPIDTGNPFNLLKGIAMGPWATDEGRAYIKEGYHPISATRTKSMENAVDAGVDPKEFYTAYRAQQGAEGIKDREGDTVDLSMDRKRKKDVDDALPEVSVTQRRKIYEALGISKKVW